MFSTLLLVIGFLLIVGALIAFILCRAEGGCFLFFLLAAGLVMVIVAVILAAPDESETEAHAIVNTLTNIRYVNKLKLFIS